ncbi:hypothetical protein BN874_1600003 [Candidatus Contendobacter odensis Run_B_J11]|uniref:Uncharacterized protein n=1 Tax=Candidatus Contendobacter odensis Run_B_J11 TaxID=1400861 RepID=A0A7U7J2M8_9GAMM|nr:hypothetical protein BN874_1600003 [Candidatus Contendobacter odensis Run_B_J11]
MNLAPQFQKLAAFEQLCVLGKRRVYSGFFGSKAAQVLNLGKEVFIKFEVGSHTRSR